MRPQTRGVAKVGSLSEVRITWGGDARDGNTATAMGLDKDFPKDPLLLPYGIKQLTFSKLQLYS